MCCLKESSNHKIKLAIVLIIPGVEIIAVLETHWAHRAQPTNSSTHTITPGRESIIIFTPEILGIPGIADVKEGHTLEAEVFNQREDILEIKVSFRITTDKVSKFITRPNFAGFKTAKGVNSAEEESFINRYILTITAQVMNITELAMG